MAQPIILSQLCTTCRNQVPKYTCPRCSAKICSVECSQRHKKIAQCNGQRNPAKFVKKDDLATPAGVDHDYNYLTSLERAVVNADKQAGDQGVAKDPCFRHRQVERRCDDLGIRIQQMPKGMSRHKENKTRWNPKRKCIQWTVEWFFPDGTREFSQANDKLSIREGYGDVSSQMGHKRKRCERRQILKAKRRSVENLESEYNDNIKHSRPIKDVLQANANYDGGSPSEVKIEPPDSPLVLPSGVERSSQDIVGDEHREIAMVKKEEAASDSDSDVEIRTEPLPLPGPSSAGPAPKFFLQRPFSRANVKVLIPLDGKTTLAQAIGGRDVVEFPTIYVVSGNADELPSGLQLEADYDAETRALIEKNEQDLKDAGVNLKDEAPASENSIGFKEEQPLDENKLQEILRQDIKSGS